MKNLFLKKMLPVAVFLLGILGAFTTMSMQDADVVAAPKTGWHANAAGQPCMVELTCSDIPGQVCRASYPNGLIAYDKPTGCVTAVFRPL